MKKINGIFTFIIVLLLSACQIGLGGAVDITGPVVSITSPGQRESVSDNFSISGTASDDFGIGLLTVKIDDNIWKYEKASSSWTFKEKGSQEYVDWSDATWESSDAKTYKWQIDNVSISSSGSKVLEVNSVDTSGNTSAESKKTRTIIIDRNPPLVTLSSPAIKYFDFNSIKNSFGNNYQQLQTVNSLKTGGFIVSGISKDDDTVGYVRVFVNLVDDNGEPQKLIEKNIVLSGRNYDLPDPIEKDSLRSWSVEITDEDLSSLDGNKHYLQIATECSDISGNKDSEIKNHGYLLLWKDADCPWLSVNISEEKLNPTDVYSGASVQGTAFDNEQVYEIIATVSKTDGAPVEGFSNKVIYKYDESSGETSQTSGFQVTYPSEVGKYTIEIFAKDKKGNVSATVTKYIYVLDKTFPSLKFGDVENSFGDSDGNVSIDVFAYDDTKVSKVLIAYTVNADDKIKLFDKSNSIWETTKGPSTTIKEVKLKPDGEVTADGFTQKQYKGEFKFNLFDYGVGMSGTKLTDLTFVLRVEDEQGNKSIAKVVTPGDSVPPEITLDLVNGSAATENQLPAFKGDFEISGTWDDDSYGVWNSLETKKAPSITVSVNGNSEVVTKESNAWKVTVPFDHVKESGVVKGAMSVVISITDIGGNTVTKQYGYQIDTNAPRLEFVSCDKTSGTYPEDTEFELALHFNKNIYRSQSIGGTDETFCLKLNNGGTAEYVSGIDSKVLKFKYKAGKGSDTNGTRLLIDTTNLNFGTWILADINGNEYSREDLKTDLDANPINKEIKILTSVPSYSSYSWDDSEKELVLKFTGNVSAKAGTIEIIQNTVLAPAVLTKDEYNSMSPAVQKCYEEGTNGASSTFEPDLKTKYVLEYSSNTDDTTLVEEYMKTGAHKRAVNILSDRVTRTYDSTKDITTFTLDFGELPVKGTSYSFTIPAGLVKNAAGTENQKVSEGLSFSTKGVEAPVIRIKKSEQTITDCSDTNSGSVDHPLTTTFKIDCETPGAAITYGYDVYKIRKCSVKGGDEILFDYESIKQSTNEKNITRGYSAGGKPAMSPVKDNTPSVSNQKYDSNFNSGNIQIGSDNYAEGLTFKITASASTGSENPAVELAYAVAYRTTLELYNFEHLVTSDGKNLSKTYLSYWTPNSNYAVFLRGGNNKEGANSVSGLPCSWDISKKNEIIMMKKNSGTNNYYFTTWNISVDEFYFQPVGGLVDDKTNTANGNAGPAKSIYLQNGIVFRLPLYPIGKGEYMSVDYAGSEFDLSIQGKVMNHR